MKSVLQRHATPLFFAVLALVLLAVYGPSLTNELIFDDARLSDGTIFGQYGGLLDFRQRLISYGSFVWADALSPQNWPLQRLINVAIHLEVAVAIFALFARLLRQLPAENADSSEATEKSASGNASYRLALGVGVAWFALNPVAVYAVGYLIQRSILLATLFTVLALWALVRGLAERRPLWYGLSALLYVLAVFSKEHAFMAAALVVPVYVFVRRPAWKTVLAVLVSSLVVVGLAATVLYQIYGQIVGTAFDENSRQFIAQLEQLSPGISERIFGLSIANQMALFFQYGFLWALPYVGWMSIDLRPAFPLSWTDWRALLALVAYLGLFGGAAWAVLRRSDALGLVGLCLLMPLLMFATEFVTVWVQDPFVLYRSYLWAIGLPGLIALGLAGLPRRLLVPAAGLLGLLLAALSFERMVSLKNDYTVWSDAVEKIDLQAPASAVGRWRPYVNRGAAHLERSTPEAAMQDFQRAVALGEQYGSAVFNMGVSLQLLKRHPEALSAFSQAQAKGFDEAALYFHQGESLFALGRFTDAFDSYSRSLERPQAAQAAQYTRVRRAEAAIPARRNQQAIDDLKQLLSENPDNTWARVTLGMAYVGLDQADAALAVFEEQLARQPSAVAFYGRALAHFVAGRRERSREDLNKALELDPQNPMFRPLREQLGAAR